MVMCAEAGGSHDTLLDIRKGQPVQKQGIEDSCDRVYHPRALL